PCRQAAPPVEGAAHDTGDDLLERDLAEIVRVRIAGTENFPERGARRLGDSGKEIRCGGGVPAPKGRDETRVVDPIGRGPLVPRRVLCTIAARVSLGGLRRNGAASSHDTFQLGFRTIVHLPSGRGGPGKHDSSLRRSSRGHQAGFLTTTEQDESSANPFQYLTSWLSIKMQPRVRCCPRPRKRTIGPV